MLCVVVCVSIWAFALSLSATQARKYLGKDSGDDDDFSVFLLPSMDGILSKPTHTQAGRRCRQQEESYITRGNSVFNSEKTQHEID